MKEYIDRQEAIEKIREYKGYFQDQESSKHIILKMEAENVISDLEAADVAPVMHGWWVDNGAKDSNGVSKPFAIRCSECKSSAGTSWMKYCPNCGAKMDGGKSNGC